MGLQEFFSFLRTTQGDHFAGCEHDVERVFDFAGSAPVELTRALASESVSKRDNR
jgi:hypothetical protein